MNTYSQTLKVSWWWPCHGCMGWEIRWCTGELRRTFWVNTVSLRSVLFCFLLSNCCIWNIRASYFNISIVHITVSYFSCKQLAFGMVIPSLELTGWSSRQLRSSVPTLYTTLKLVVPKRKVNDWSSNGDSASAINRVEEVESVEPHSGSAQLTDR